jgi:2,3-bisphosphoglycerate-independent phosphoglycerate mutase
MWAAGDALAPCELNSVRRDLGENPITGAWLWGEGPRPRLPMFRERFGVGATAIGENALFRGIARVARIETPAPSAADQPVPPATLRSAAVAALQRQDLVIVHSSDADAAGHAGDAAGKVAALERIDRELLGPLTSALQTHADWRILILTAHATPCAARRHADVATPFALAGTRIESNRGEAFDELHAAEGEMRMDRGCDLMEYFLRT